MAAVSKRRVELIEASWHVDPDRVRWFRLMRPKVGDPTDAPLVLEGTAAGARSPVMAVEALVADRVVARADGEIVPAAAGGEAGDTGGGEATSFRFEVPARGEGEDDVHLWAVLATEERVSLATLRIRVSQPGDRFTPLEWGKPDPRQVEGEEPHPVGDENVIWIFGAGRSGTTWLASMLGALPGFAMWDEPLVGALFGDFYRRHHGDDRGDKFIMGPLMRDVWLPTVREMVLRGAEARFQIPASGRIVVK
jgi:hypothetical protein